MAMRRLKRMSRKSRNVTDCSYILWQTIISVMIELIFAVCGGAVGSQFINVDHLHYHDNGFFIPLGIVVGLFCGKLI